MAVVEIIYKGIDDGATKVANDVSDDLGGLGSLAAGTLTAGFAAAAAGAVALGAGLGISLSAAMDNEKIQASLSQAIKASGGAAGITAEAANQLAQQFTNLAGGSDDAILAIETIGIRAGTISSQQMPAFIQSTLDLGAVMGDTSAAATLLARAQEDPVAALGKLQRAGIIFSQDLKDQIKDMAKAGDTAGATALLMDRVAEATGGAAAANAGTLAGQFEILKGTLGEAAESIGMSFLPLLHDLFERVIKPLIPVITELAMGLGSQLSSALSVVTDSLSLFTDQTSGAVDIVGVITNILYNMGGAFADVGDAILALSQNDPTAFFNSISAMFTDLAAQIGPMIQPVIESIKKWLIDNVPVILATLQSWADAFIAWVSPMIPPLLLELGKLEIQFINWLAAQIPPLIVQLQAWGQEFVNWVGPQIPPLIAEAKKLAAQLMAWLAAQIPPLVAQLLAWGQEFVNWVAPQIPPLLVELGKLLGQMTAWIITTGVPALVEKIKEWATAFMDWVMKPGGAKDQVLPALGKFLYAVGQFVITDMLPGFVGFAKSFIDSLLEGFNTNLPTLINNVTSMGTSIINGIVAGIKAAPGSVLSALWDIVNGAIEEIKRRLGISSPSTVFAGIGENMMVGLAQGISGSAGQPVAAATSAVNRVVNSSVTNNYNLSVNNTSGAVNVPMVYGSAAAVAGSY